MVKQLIQLVVLGAFFVMPAVAASLPANITPEQIEMFKRLPRAQQEQLARQYGVDLNAILSAGSTQAKAAESEQIAPLVLPREQIAQDLVADETKKDQGLKRFGYDLFAGQPTTFAPVSDIPVPPNFVIGPNDSVTVMLFGKQSATYQLTVQRDGTILFPELGPIAVAGLTFSDMQALLQKRIANQMIGVEAAISMGTLRNIRVFVLGDAWKPGSYTVSALSTVTNALFVSGGIKETGSLRNIEIKRDGKLIGRLDLYELLMKGDTSSDMRLQQGDVIFIPPVGATASVDGQIYRSAVYEFKSGETVGDLLAMSGGLKPDAYADKAILDRVDARRLRSATTVSLLNKHDLTTPLRSGDYLRVGSISDQFDDSVVLDGAVYRPGAYGWRSGLKISDLIASIYTDVWEEADLEYALVVREKNARRDIEVIQFRLSEALTDPASTDNVQLKARDRVLVFSNKRIALTTAESSLESQSLVAQIETDSSESSNVNGWKNDEEERWKKTQRETLLAPVLQKLYEQARGGEPLAVVTVSGQVRFPGEYPLAVNASVRSLVRAGGGLSDGAYAVSAEVTRIDLSNALEANIEHINVKLASIMEGVVEADLSLQSRDHLMVRQIPSWQEQLTVELKGEFRFPGKYKFRRGETLKQLIERAGGFTDYSFIDGSVFLREELRKRELERLQQAQAELQQEVASSALTQESSNRNVDITRQQQAAKLLDQVSRTKAVGRLVIDLRAIIAGSDQDIQLQPGDVLVVPSTRQSVTVIGEVQFATSHLYKNGLDFKDYINRSGGMTAKADDDRLYVIRANGEVFLPGSSGWFSTRKAAIQPGDTIVVPLDTNYMRPLEFWSSVTQIIYNSAVALAAIGSL